MTQEELGKILPSISEKLRKKYKVEPEIHQQEGRIIVRGFSPPYLEEISQLIADVVRSFNLNYKNLEWIKNTTANRDLIIEYFPKSPLNRSFLNKIDPVT